MNAYATICVCPLGIPVGKLVTFLEVKTRACVRVCVLTFTSARRMVWLVVKKKKGCMAWGLM